MNITYSIFLERYDLSLIGHIYRVVIKEETINIVHVEILLPVVHVHGLLFKIFNRNYIFP